VPRVSFQWEAEALTIEGARGDRIKLPVFTIHGDEKYLIYCLIEEISGLLRDLVIDTLGRRAEMRICPCVSRACDVRAIMGMIHGPADKDPNGLHAHQGDGLL
jgi:hypothetical protein